MDFFGRQENYEAQSRTFFIAFFVTVAAAVVVFYFMVTACLAIACIELTSAPGVRSTGGLVGDLMRNLPAALYGSPPKVLSLGSFLKVGGLITGLILAVSWYKTRRIKRGGGAYLAGAMGGRLIETPADFTEKQLLNVVEEMAVASGLPRPRVYVLPKERSINAVTAGLDHDDAVIAVTAGALAHLTREELQGVVAHEFAHIWNGDCALNLTMAGWLYGLLIFHAQGRDLLFIGSELVFGRGGDKDEGSGFGALSLPVFAVGLILAVGGWMGYLAAKLVEAAFSRRREHLADALAVRFTRQTAGLAGALKKIAAFPLHGSLKSGQASMMHSFFIASPAAFEGLLRSHPPLGDRIFELEPDWDGVLPEIELPPEPPSALRRLIQPGEGAPVSKITQGRRLNQAAESLPDDWTGLLVLGLLASGEAAPGRPAIDPGGARRLLEGLAPALRRALDDPGQAPALTAAVLLRGDETVLAKQLELIRRLWDEPAAGAAAALRPLFTEENRLPLLGLMSPRLKGLDPDARERLGRLVKALAAADGRLDLFEIAAAQILKKYLGGLRTPPAAAPASLPEQLAALKNDVAAVLSLLAHLGAEDPEKAEAALAAGLVRFNQWPPLPLVPRDEISAAALMRALDRLGRTASIHIKRDLILAAVAVALHDHRINQREYELLRALAAALDIPLPRL